MISSSPSHRKSSSTIFQGLTAWFSPELQAYVGSWVAHGGIVKDIEEADIAFVSDRTKQDGQTSRPMMRILRPEWIVDSITGKAVVSLNRYKTAFPALESWETSSYHCSSNGEDEGRSSIEVSSPQSGMEALRSRNVLYFSPSSAMLHQPVPDFQYLSLTPSTEASNSGSNHQIWNRNTPTQSPTAVSSTRQPQRAIRDITIATTRTLSGTVDVAVRELDTFLQGNVSSESEDGGPPTQYSGTMDPPLGQKRVRIPSQEEQSSILISDSLSPQPVPKKRRLPGTVLRNKRLPPAKRDTQLDEDFFCTDSEDEVEPCLHAKEHLQNQPPGISSSSSSGGDKGQRKNTGQSKGSDAGRAVISMDAESYLQQVWTKLNAEQRSMLMGTSTHVLGIVNIPETDISMHRRKKAT